MHPSIPGACALVLLLAAGPVHAWSAPGHRVVGLAAEQLLTGDARREIRALVGEQDLGEVGLWLDQERDRLRTELPGSDRWHYDNRPVCEPGAPRERWCADGHCASLAFGRWLEVLADRSRPDEERAFALRVVVHLVGDVHQPLHAGDNRDRGGNDINVASPRGERPRTLHGHWDRELVELASRGDSERQFARRLVSERRDRIAAIQQGGIDDWMQESYELSRELTYGRLPGFACGASPPFLTRLPDDYRRDAAVAIRERIARAGIRLAGVLNEALAR